MCLMFGMACTACPVGSDETFQDGCPPARAKRELERECLQGERVGERACCGVVRCE